MKKQRKGFAVLKKTNPNRMKEICSKGGKTAHKLGMAHEWTKEEAKIAGRKGGLNSHKND